MSDNDNQVTHEGVIYSLMKDLPPLKFHVVSCPRCGGAGQMYSRKCKECKGRGLLFPPLSDEQAGRLVVSTRFAPGPEGTSKENE